MAGLSNPRLRRLRHYGELWLAGWLRRYYALRRRSLEIAPEPAFASHVFGDDARPNGRDIPALVWTYWTGAEPPLVVRRCVARWRLLNPGFDIRVLDDRSAAVHGIEWPPALAAQSPTRRADWLRLEVLRRHGGIWLDASIILTQPLDWVLALQRASRSDFIGYRLALYTADPAWPVVENWFMAAPPNSPFIDDLQHEFTTEVIPRSGEGYVGHLQALGLYDALVQRIDMPSYLSMHLALQRILRAGGRYRLHLAEAEAGPYFYHVLGRWRRTPLKLRLMFSRIRGALPPLVKLRSPDRKRLDDYLSRGCFLPDSIVGRYLGE
ncbi:MAG TPA: capsular polysaccharide synthesis protein [Luteimonas sp.]|nr:capsular polysaccharide synthesis protein [Luteimonas sp.]